MKSDGKRGSAALRVKKQRKTSNSQVFRVSLSILHIPTQTRFRSVKNVAVLSSKVPRSALTFFKGLLMEYAICPIRLTEIEVLQLPNYATAKEEYRETDCVE